MRKDVAVIATLLALAIVGGGVAYKAVRDSPTKDVPPGDSGVVTVSLVGGESKTSGDINNAALPSLEKTPFLVSYNDDDTPIVQVLRLKDDSWVRHTTSDLSKYEATMSQTEEARRLRAEQRAQMQEQFLERQQQLAAEQQELLDTLNEKALEAISAQGGVIDDVGEDGLPTAEQRRDVLHQALAGQQTGQAGANNDASDAQSSSTGRVEEPEYLGQFTAHFYCTCADCFDESQWRRVKQGDNYILGDPKYLEPGIFVTLSEGSEQIFEVRDGTGTVAGRAMMVFNNNHSEYNGNATLYPKVTRVNATGGQSLDTQQTVPDYPVVSDTDATSTPGTTVNGGRYNGELESNVAYPVGVG